MTWGQPTPLLSRKSRRSSFSFTLAWLLVYVGSCRLSLSREGEILSPPPLTGLPVFFVMVKSICPPFPLFIIVSDKTRKDLPSPPLARQGSSFVIPPGPVEISGSRTLFFSFSIPCITRGYVEGNPPLYALLSILFPIIRGFLFRC